VTCTVTVVIQEGSASADFEQMIFETMMELNIVPAEMAALDMSSVVGVRIKVL
jgi:hypothetical protein